MDRVIDAAGGRVLTVEEDGEPGGIPVLVHNGTPNSRHLYAPNAADAAGRGIRLIGYDRPGYGGSTPSPGRAVAECTGDVRAICAALRIDRLMMWGISGGGPHVLACAALLPDLVVAAASLASPAPHGAGGLDWFAGMGELNVDDFKLLLRDRDAARVKLEKDREAFLSASAEEIAEMIASLVSPADAAVLGGGIGEYLAECGRLGLAPGAEGWWEDSLAEMEPWGFSFDAIAIPILLLHGRQDRFVPVGHGEWLASRIPGVEARLTDEDGHLTLLVRRVGEVHAWLLSNW